ncbi:PREDICTED: cordon-bleu protein-like 1 isoform X2 [Nanorana parkeri]|uniref:cordon-bleu protein-like 1 isoform X2 n=1 Tax=Nanorana parkeri TaxID=125878 RepID=UPI0008547220|nr:PREDICTED: cordon-bleu protein-like 1 isoform X2 [Nanorana parkeri]
MKGKLQNLLCWRKKSKGKAPLPPGDTRCSDSLPSFDSADTNQYNMDQKENIIDRDIELNVVLPGDRVTSTTVNGSKPMMDLLVFLCGQYHLNPSTYTIELFSADKSLLKFKPNTPIGMLEVEKVVLKSKNLEDRHKKPGPMMPEQTVRVVINYRRTQKTVMRVSPFVPLQDLIPSICSKCEFDPQTTVLLHDYQSHKSLDITKSLNDLGLRELYALDQSKATSPTEIRQPPLQESCQNVEIKQNDDKRFLKFFRRSTKKKRDQTSSAPATPLLNKQRPPQAVRENTVIKSYDSNTLPSDVPKKRRAPLPPMHPPQNNPIPRGQIRTSSCVVKSTSVDESGKCVSGFDRSRTGSFQHGGTSSFNSSIRRTKRKAPPPPAPPSNPLQASDENSNEIVHDSQEVNDVEVESDETNHYSPAQEDVVPELDQQRVEEKNESSVSLKLEENTSLKEEATGFIKKGISISSSEERVETLVTEEITSSELHSSSMVSNYENLSKISEDEIITDGTSSLLSRDDAVMENTTLEYDKICERENRTSTPTAEVENIQIFGTKTVVTEQGSQTLSSEQHTKDTNIVFQNYRHITETETHEDLKINTTEKGKTQDSAVQTVNFDNDAETIAEEFSHSRESTFLTTVSSTNNVQHIPNGHAGQLTQFNGQQMVVTGKEPSKEDLVDNLRQSMHTQTIEESTIEGSRNSQSKTLPFYRQHSDPKPKPSNEITRDYLPKIGMTTYKIVPQRSFDVERYMESESPQDVHNNEYRPVNEHMISHTVTNSNATSPLGEKHILLSEVKNGDHSPEGSSTYSISTASKTVAGPSERDHLALSRNVSAAPVLSTNKTAPEVKPKPKPTSPVKGPSSFYLQMQRRASSMYVTSAIAKTKSSSSVANSTAKPKDLGNEASQITIKTLPSRINVVNMTSSFEEKLPGDRLQLVERPEVKNGGLGAIHEGNFETENKISASHSSPESHVNLVHKEVSSVGVLAEHKKHVWFQENRIQDVEPPLQVKFSELTNTIPEIYRAGTQVVQQDYKADVLSTTTSSKLTRTLSSPTGQSAPLSFQKLSTFVTPKPFTSTNTNPFSSSVTSSVKRSQSFNSSISPVKQPLNVDGPIGWSPVTSPVDFKKDSPDFSVSLEEITENETLTPALKYRVHSPPPVPEKKTTVSFPSPDPEQLRQNILSAIRSGEAAAKLKRITIRSSTISINGKSQISHPTFSQSLPED